MKRTKEIDLPVALPPVQRPSKWKARLWTFGAGVTAAVLIGGIVNAINAKIQMDYQTECARRALVVFATSVCLNDKTSRCFVTPEHLFDMRDGINFMEKHCGLVPQIPANRNPGQAG